MGNAKLIVLQKHHAYQKVVVVLKFGSLMKKKIEKSIVRRILVLCRDVLEVLETLFQGIILKAAPPLWVFIFSEKSSQSKMATIFSNSQMGYRENCIHFD